MSIGIFQPDLYRKKIKKLLQKAQNTVFYKKDQRPFLNSPQKIQMGSLRFFQVYVNGL